MLFFIRIRPILMAVTVFFIAASSATACESGLAFAQFHQTYDTMISGAAAEQEGAAAKFLTSQHAQLSQITDPSSLLPGLSKDDLMRAIGGATELANAIRENRHPSSQELASHRAQLAIISTAFADNRCNLELVLTSLKPKPTDPVRNAIAICLSILALLVFLHIVLPRNPRIWRWLKKRTVRHELLMVLKVRVEDESGEKNIRVRGMDLTQGGIQLFWPSGAPNVGVRLTVFLPELEKPAKIVWSNTFNTGVAFDEPMNEEQVEMIALAADKERIRSG